MDYSGCTVLSARYQIPASTLISTDITTDKIIKGRCFIDLTPSYISYVKHVILIYGIQVFFSFFIRNEFYIIWSFVFYAFICQQANTIRVYIIILYVNSTAEETWWSLQLDVGKKYTYISVSVSITDQMSCKILPCWISAKKFIIMHPCYLHLLLLLLCFVCMCTLQRCSFLMWIIKVSHCKAIESHLGLLLASRCARFIKRPEIFNFLKGQHLRSPNFVRMLLSSRLYASNISISEAFVFTCINFRKVDQIKSRTAIFMTTNLGRILNCVVVLGQWCSDV